MNTTIMHPIFLCAQWEPVNECLSTVHRATRYTISIDFVLEYFTLCTHMTVALIIGITGQDGYYLSQFLLEKEYIVHGLVRRTSHDNMAHLKPFFNQITFHYGDLCDQDSINRIVALTAPDEIYNLGAMSDVGASFNMPEYTADVDGIGVLRVLNAVRMCQHLTGRRIRFYQASTSELFGNSISPQSEITPFDPRSPYACAKMYGFNIVKNYREAYGLFACNGILFNHESPKRGKEFVTRKITLAIADIVAGKSDYVLLGNLNSRRDWGHAADYVRAMWLMMQQSDADDYVIATGESNTIKTFATVAFARAGMQLTWSGRGVDEVGCDQFGNVRVRCDKKYFRPSEVDDLCGDSTYARNMLGWKPTVNFRQLVHEMVDADTAVNRLTNGC